MLYKKKGTTEQQKEAVLGVLLLEKRTTAKEAAVPGVLLLEKRTPESS